MGWPRLLAWCGMSTCRLRSSLSVSEHASCWDRLLMFMTMIARLSCGIRSLRFLTGKERTCDLANGRLSFTAVLSDLHSVLPHPSVSTLLSFATWLLGLRCANYNVASKHNGISEYHIPKLTSLLSPEHCSPYTLSNLICELLTNAIMNPTKQANGLLHNES